MNRRIDGDGSHEFLPRSGPHEVVEFEFTPEQLATVQKAAAIKGISVEDFIRRVLKKEMEKGSSFDGIRDGRHES